MKKKIVKVFNAYGDKNEYYEKLGVVGFDKFEYHNQILNLDGTVSPKSDFERLKPIKPLSEDVIEKYKYEFSSEEQKEYKRRQAMRIRMHRVYEKAREREESYYRKMIDKIKREFPDEQLYGGDQWECWLSPVGHCIYHNDDSGEAICIFCGEPEERK